MSPIPTREVCASLAELLSYPRRDVPGIARRAASSAGNGSPCAVALARFARAVEALAPSALEELHTSTFDLEPACAPYLGVQLLGDDNPVRGLFLAKLVEVYAADGFRPREELADHVAEVFGYLAVARPGAARDDLVRDGLVPALERMIRALECPLTLDPSPPRSGGEGARERGGGEGAGESSGARCTPAQRDRRAHANPYRDLLLAARELLLSEIAAPAAAVEACP